MKSIEDLKNTSLAVFTSGGDAQGMNAAIRSVVRYGLRSGCKVYFIREGYAGLLADKVEEATWKSVENIINQGGTMIGSTRCEEFTTRQGRKKGALVLLNHRIYNLVCIGGDGSLTGLHLFKAEWPAFVQELLVEGKIEVEHAEEAKDAMRVVGLVGSIDNDFVGTDRTIGSDSAMARILESVDAVVATASSHQRTFIVEVMGRNCGHLALTAAIALEADFVFIPEIPPSAEWKTEMCEQLETMRKVGRRLNIIILSEGAIDLQGNRILAQQVKDAVVEKLKHETRITQLGHIQRGGSPSFLDRMLGTRMGQEAVRLLLSNKYNEIPMVLCLKGHTIQRMQLLTSVSKTRRVKAEVSSGEFDAAAKLRGANFVQKTDCIQYICEPPKPYSKFEKKFAIIHIGTPCAGMNAATQAFTRIADHFKVQVLGTQGGWDGFKEKNFMTLSWSGVIGWMAEGGSLLGSKKQLPSEMNKIAKVMEDEHIDGLVIVGGFEAFHSAVLLEEARSQYSSLKIPVVVIPATVTNNVPGSCISLGSDTSLNEICRQVDNIRLSARGSKNRVMLIEVWGDNGGYLAVMTACATGAGTVLTRQTKHDEQTIREIAKSILFKTAHGVDNFVIVRSNGAHDELNIFEIQKILQDEFKGKLDVGVNMLAHSQEGGAPSAFDRQMGLRMGIRAFEGLFDTNKMLTFAEVCVLGLQNRHMVFSSVSQLSFECCFRERISCKMWWNPLTEVIEQLEVQIIMSFLILLVCLTIIYSATSLQCYSGWQICGDTSIS